MDILQRIDEVLDPVSVGDAVAEVLRAARDEIVRLRGLVGAASGGPSFSEIRDQVNHG